PIYAPWYTKVNRQRLTRVQRSDTSGRTRTRCLENVAQTRAVGYSWSWRRRDCGGVNSRACSTDAMYATQQKADIHGIAFGQRLIDGKVEGHSVMDMKTEDRRATPRFRVQFRTTVSGPTQPEGIGTMLDLSTGGCRLKIPFVIAPGLSLELRIHVPGLEWPLMIDGAHVQWVSGQIVGLAFFQI